MQVCEPYGIHKSKDDDIPIQVCEPYVIHKTKNITREAVYECPDINVDDTPIYET